MRKHEYDARKIGHRKPKAETSVTDVLARKATKYSVLMVLAASAWLAPALAVPSQEIDQAKSLKVKAAYLYNFAKFIEWPEAALGHEGAPFVIGVLGEDPFGQRLDDTVKGKEIAKRPVKIRRLRWSKREDRAELKNCQILFISDSERRRLQEIFEAVEDQPVLLVADVPSFASDGGMIGFVLEHKRIIFEINREALEQANLKASAKLLKLARIVQPMDRKPRGLRTPKSKP